MLVSALVPSGAKLETFISLAPPVSSTSVLYTPVLSATTIFWESSVVMVMVDSGTALPFTVVESVLVSVSGFGSVMVSTEGDEEGSALV